VEDTYGEDNLQLTIARSYLAKWLKNLKIARWLATYQPEYLAEFQEITEMDSLAAATGKAAS
jgi:hypothetical protein